MKEMTLGEGDAVMMETGERELALARSLAPGTGRSRAREFVRVEEEVWHTWADETRLDSDWLCRECQCRRAPWMDGDELAQLVEEEDEDSGGGGRGKGRVRTSSLSPERKEPIVGAGGAAASLCGNKP